MVAAPAGAASWRWSRGYALPGAPQGIGGLSCPSTRLCVAVGPVGNPDCGKATNDLYWTTNPTAGR
jgi:hypothetical protein